jgi:short subunit dehydrogenase-like uncharacterized protein
MHRDSKGPIWVFGATGRGGRAIARELVDTGADVVLLGRDRDRLAAVAASLGERVRSRVTSGPDELTTLITAQRPAVVVNTVGPFTAKR